MHDRDPLRKAERDIHVVFDEQHGDRGIEARSAGERPAIASSSNNSRGRPASASATSSLR
jgi:hypothetical protein